MAQFTVNTHRLDPYKNMKFRVRWDGKVVAGVSKVSALKHSTEPVMHREGGADRLQHASPSIFKFEPITLERGVTHDPEFEAWARLIYSTDGDAAISLKNFRKDIFIDLYNDGNQLVLSYKVYRCWVSEYQALPELDANAHAVAIEHIVLQNEGWERDTAVTEPAEN